MNTETKTLGSCRFAANDRIMELAKTTSDLFFISCDNTADNSPQMKLASILNERYIDCGIAEQDAVGIASGLALSGKKVILQTFASFLSLRSIEQIYLDCCYNHAHVVLMGTHSGTSANTAGPTHGALLDYGYLRCMPGMTVIAPSDPTITGDAVEAALSLDGPVYIRVSKGMEPRVYSDGEVSFQLGKSIAVRNGNDLTMIGCGCGVWYCKQAAERLTQEGISARVLDMHTIMPLDKEAIIKAAQDTKRIIVCEDHMVTGGLGSAVAEVICENGIGAKLIRLGMPDCFYTQGDRPDEIHHKYGYDAEGVYLAAKELIK